MARLLKKVVTYARALGELEYRQSLNESEMKQIHLNLKRKGALCVVEKEGKPDYGVSGTGSSSS